MVKKTWCVCFFHLFLFGAVWFIHNRIESVGPDTPGIILLYDVYKPGMYLHIKSAVLLLLLLLFVLLPGMLLLVLQQPLMFVISVLYDIRFLLFHRI